MDIRIVGESIFDVQADCVLYCVDNAFSEIDSKELVLHSGDRMLEIFSKISSLSNYGYKIVPAFDIKSIYVALFSLPRDLKSEDDEKEVCKFLKDMFSNFKDREFTKIAIDLKRLEKSFGNRYSEIFKNFIKNMQNCGEDFVIFLCK